MNRQRHEKQKNPLFSAIDKAPFAGKFTIKDAYVGFETATDKTKTIKAVGAVALFSLMVSVHAVQAKMGGESFVTHLGDATDGSALSGALAVVDAAYFGTMTAAGQLAFGASYLHAQEVEHQNRLDNLVRVDPLTPEEYEQQYGETGSNTDDEIQTPDPADIVPRDTIDVTIDTSSVG